MLYVNKICYRLALEFYTEATKQRNVIQNVVFKMRYTRIKKDTLHNIDFNLDCRFCKRTIADE